MLLCRQCYLCWTPIHLLVPLPGKWFTLAKLFARVCSAASITEPRRTWRCTASSCLPAITYYESLRPLTCTGVTTIGWSRHPTPTCWIGACRMCGCCIKYRICIGITWTLCGASVPGQWSTSECWVPWRVLVSGGVWSNEMGVIIKRLMVNIFWIVINSVINYTYWNITRNRQKMLITLLMVSIIKGLISSYTLINILIQIPNWRGRNISWNYH